MTPTPTPADLPTATAARPGPAAPDPAGPQVVVIAHAADRTGPPRVLLHQLRWVRAHTDWDLRIVLLRGGELLDDFAALGPVVVLGDPAVGRLDPAARAEEDRRDAERRARLAHLADADLVYINTAWSIHGLRYLPERRDRPVLAAIHELDHDLRDGMPPASLADLLGRPDHFIAGAEIIARNLVAGYGIPADRITVVPEAIELPEPAAPPERASLGWADDEVVVVGAGGPAHRKGTDLFVHAAWHARRLAPELPLRFVWIGADLDAEDTAVALSDRSRLGLDATVELRPRTDRPIEVFRSADVFVLPSREDASPLVALEAGAVGTPIVCFDVGGTADLVGDDGGIVVPYPDVPALAAALVELAADPARRDEMGATLAARVAAERDIALAGPALVAAVERWLR